MNSIKSFTPPPPPPPMGTWWEGRFDEIHHLLRSAVLPASRVSSGKLRADGNSNSNSMANGPAGDADSRSNAASIRGYQPN